MMPMGDRQTNDFLHSTLDVWHDRVFFNGRAYPAGYFAASVLNIPAGVLDTLMEKSRVLKELWSPALTLDEAHYANVCRDLQSTMLEMAELLWQYEPFSLIEQERERNMLAELSDPDFFSDFIRSDTEDREVFSRYIDAMFRLPYALHHFVTAGQYFVSRYLRRLRKRNETHFAVAAYECTHDDLFLRMMDELPCSHIEPFVSPQLRTTYMFANDPGNKKEVVFVSRMRFESYMAFLGFDLFNGLHHGHAPSQCRGCGKYFLTTDGHKPKYCDGIAPQDPRLTCRQYGAMARRKENNRDHPIYRVFATRTNTIRKHHQRGKISDDLRREALYVAECCRDKALMDNDYASNGYERDMEQEHIYAEAKKRLK